MTLPSQTARAGGSGRVYTSKRPFKLRLSPPLIAMVVVGGVVIIALASWGLGGIGKKSEGPKNEPIDTSVASEPVPDERGLKLPGPASANAGTSKNAKPSGGSSLARQPVQKPETQPEVRPEAKPGNVLPKDSGTMAMLPPTKDPAGEQPLVIQQGGLGSTPSGGAGDAGQLSRALTEKSGTPAPTDPNVITPLPGNGLPNVTGNNSGATPPSNPPAVTPGSTPTDPATTQPPAALSEMDKATQGADEKIKSGDLVAARRMLSQALGSARTEAEKTALRQKLSAINEDLVFSPKVYAGDTFVETYVVQPGDALAKIASKRDLATDWRLIQRINRLSNPNRISVGQKLKLVRGPFHAVVTKSAYRLDLYMGSPDEPNAWMFVKAFRVGLGEGNGTPTGNFVVKKNSKLVNPYWVNPRTGEKFEADDPKNPIGEFWIGIEGVGESAPYVGYGLHGTIEPESIGQQKSMGCVRMGAEDIAQVYELLIDGVSVVKIVP